MGGVYLVDGLVICHALRSSGTCRLACAHDFIMSFPDQYDHKIEQGGTNVSGGQKQRLRIARALLKKPKILILDDSSSALDYKTDLNLRRAISEIGGDTTVILVAQRISSVMNSDLIIVLEEGEIKVGPFDAAYPVGARIGGTPCNDVYQAYIDRNNNCIKESKERMKLAQQSIPDGIRSDQAAELAFTSPTFYVNNLHFKVSIMDFVYDNIESPVVLYIIKYAIVPTFTTDVVKEFLDALPQELHVQPMYKELVNEILAANLKVGAEAPDITGRTPEGKELSLSDFKGKYVFIDFWASWCGPCRKAMPQIKEIYEKYGKKGLAVVSLSLDTDGEAWKKAIDELGMTWTQLCNPDGGSREVGQAYGIEFIPTMLIISQDGKIAARGLEGEALAKKIEELMK